MIIHFKNKRIEIEAVKVGFFRKAFGLMFRGRYTKNLLFEFKNECRPALTSIFVFFPFLAVWLDNENRVIDFSIIKPFTASINTKNKFRKIVEIPINSKNKDIVYFFVGKRKI